MQLNFIFFDIFIGHGGNPNGEYFFELPGEYFSYGTLLKMFMLDGLKEPFFTMENILTPGLTNFDPMLLMLL